MAFEDLGLRHAVGCGLDDFDLQRHGVADTFDLAELIEGCGDDAVEIAEVVEQRAGEWLNVLPWDGAKEDEFEEFIIRNRLRAAVQEPFPKAFAVVFDVGGEFALWKCFGQREKGRSFGEVGHGPKDGVEVVSGWLTIQYVHLAISSGTWRIAHWMTNEKRLVRVRRPSPHKKRDAHR